jgi:alpha-L-arabinofuranosidase
MKRVLLVLTAIAVLILSSLPVFAEGEDIAAKHRVKLWSFESGTTEGWHGVGKWAKSCSVTKDPKFVTEGKYALKVDLTGSMDWNQDVMVCAPPFDPAINKLVELSFDVTIPQASVDGLEYQEMYLVCSSKSNAWYQLKSPLLPGQNKVVFKLDNAKIKQDMWNMYLVTNNSQPYKGPIYIDNMVGRIMGEPGNAEGRVIDKETGAPIENARVVIGDSLIITDAAGNFKVTIPEDAYKVVVVAYGYKDYNSDTVISANKTKSLGDIAILKKKEPVKKAVVINIDPAKVIRTIDKHKMFGQNIAAWHKPDGYRDAVALDKIKRIGATYFRIPGGDYANIYDWKTGEAYKYDGSIKDTQEFSYMGGMVPFLKRMDMMTANAVEVLPTINLLTPAKKTINQRLDYAIAWLQDLKDKGIKYKYVEVGNELDNKPMVPGPGKAKEGKSILDSPTDMKNIHWWTVIKNYCKVFNQASYKIKTFDKSLKVMGPVPMQPMNQERAEGDPWKATGTKTPFWVEEFLSLSGEYVDTIGVHEYPFWANNDARALLAKPQTTWPVYMPKYRDWIKKYVNKKHPNKYVEVALTEWNSGDENVMTVMMENALFSADYLGSFMKVGGDMAFVWDLYTQKPGLGGGHGLMDAENDPTSKFSERCTYWVFDMYVNRFGTRMIQCESDNPDLSVYAAMVDDSTISIMAINKTKLSISSAKINVKGFNLSSAATAWQLSDKEYVWSKELYRPIVNLGPSMINATLTNGTYDFPPYSVTVLQVKK